MNFKIKEMKRRHNRVKRRIELGVERSDDREILLYLKQQLGYK